MPIFNYTLSSWQQEFVERLVSHNSRTSLLVAPPGSGKTFTAFAAGQKAIASGNAHSLLIVSDRRVLVDSWRHVSDQMGSRLSGVEELLNQQTEAGAVITLQSLQNSNIQSALRAFAAKRVLFTIVDSVQHIGAARRTIEEALGADGKHKLLFTTTEAPEDLSWDFCHSVDSSVIFGARFLASPDCLIPYKRLAPSYGILEKILRGHISMDGLSWREFEKLIADLLISDGYTVELMQGTKDDGVDVIAVKNDGPAGIFKTLWQAKKYGENRKVGLATIRELADTGREFGASKAIVATTTFLTRGALDRIERNRFTLGKLDRLDMQSWITRHLNISR